MTILQKIQSLLTAANAKTGESDTTLTDAVQTLVDGYGQGGGSGYAKKTGSFVLTENYTFSGRGDRHYSGSILIATGLSKIEAIIIWSEEWAAGTETANCFGLSRAFLNKPVTVTGAADACHYYSGLSVIRNGTNNYAASAGQGFFFNSMDSNIPEGSFGLRCQSSSFPIIAGHTIRWEAWGEE